MIAALFLALAVAAPQESAVTQRVNPMARRAVDLPQAAPGTHSSWRETPLPPLYDLAMSAFRSGDNPGALEFLLVLLDRNPDLPPATLMLASLYFKLRRHDDAVHTFRRFLTHAPEEIQRTRHLGHSLYSLGRHDEARAHYLLVLERGPAAGGLKGVPRARALRGLGLSLRHLGELEAAQTVLETSLRFAPKDPEAHLALAQVLDELDDVEAAARSARRARSLAPFDPRAAFLLASLLSDLGESAEAATQRADFERLAPVDTLVRDLETRLLHAPRDREALRELATLHASIGDANGMQLTLRRLGGDFTGEERAWRALAGYHASVGNMVRSAEAEAHARKLERARQDR